jgi:hypothetical protein
MTGGANTTDVQLSSVTTNLQMAQNGTVVYAVTSPSPFFNTTSIVCATTLSGSSGIFINGTSQTLATNNTLAYAAATTTTQQFGISTTATFTLGEAMIFDGAVTDIDRRNVEGYLAQKWGLQPNLPATHPYYATSTTQLYKRPVFQRPFSPVDITGCSLWLDGADPSSMTFSSGTNVSVWKDKSGLANNAVQATAGYQPTYTTDAGYPAILFNSASTNYLNGGPLLASTSFSWFTVFRALTTTTTQYIFIDYKRETNQAFVQANTTTTGTADGYVFYGTTPNATFKTGSYSSVGTNKTLLEIVDSPGNNTSNFFRDGNALSTTFTNNGGTAISTDSYGYILGAGKNPSVFTSNCLNGYIYEVIVFLSELSSPQRQQVESYLAWKWGLVSNLTPSTHPGKTLPAFSTVFSPKSVSGMSLWLDAADPTTVTGTSSVTNVVDKSGNNIVLTNANGFSYPNNTFNGRYPSFYCPNGYTSSHLGYTSSFSQTTPFTVFFLAQYTSASDVSGYIMDSSPSGSSNREYTLGSYLGSPFGSSATTGLMRNPCIVCMNWIGGTSSTYINGSSNYSGSLTGFTTGGITIGNRYSINESWPGHICEFIWYSGTLSTSQRQQVEGYLAWKWGLQANLPDSHAFKKIKP